MQSEEIVNSIEVFELPNILIILEFPIIMSEQTRFNYIVASISHPQLYI